MNKREKAKLNEYLILEVLNIQKWMREFELVILSGMSLPMVRRTCIRLVKDGDIIRHRHPAGYFVRLTKNCAAKIPDGQSCYKSKLPKTWRHDCLAIQALGYIKKTREAEINIPNFVIDISTEAAIRRRRQIGKIPDGQLEQIGCALEAEWAKKVGVPMQYQSESICKTADEGFDTVVAYPYTPNLEGTINHERTITNSLRSVYGKGEMQGVKLLRCYFDSRLDMQHVRPSKFEEIAVPRFISNSNAPAVTEDIKESGWFE
ncbi:MAG: hypothetical protein WC742_10305 [Gallionellaceae bacterium]|jgi:hypothetical protein